RAPRRAGDRHSRARGPRSRGKSVGAGDRGDRGPRHRSPLASGRRHRAYARASTERGEAAMSLAAAGALAAALAATCAIFAPFARDPAAAVHVGHPDRRALDDADWRRPLWQWESLRAGCVIAGAIVALVTPLPLITLVAAAAFTPSLVVRSRAGAARARARRATTHLLRATEAAL